MGQGTTRSPFVFATLVAVMAVVSCGSKSPTTDALRHVVVVGASASAGYGTGEELGRQGTDVPLADVLRVMIRSPEARVDDASDALFLVAPDAAAAEQARNARESDPSCVIAVDYLYWFAQEGGGSLEERRERLDAGLEHLGGFECPVIVGTLPSADPPPAAGAGRSNATDPATIEALNEHIVSWAGARPNAHVVPLASSLADLRANRAVEVAGNRWDPPGALAEVLQADGRHPTVAGLALIAALCLEVLVEQGLVSGSEVDLDARAAATRFLDR